ncbi:DUF3784 domain-containing protein [Priestia flexa]|uniref:DUF3784 domain-containing protein n=1 Tax=Priestia veravalensis TaxID=1414648 RepID=A0A0V8JQ46_9BACI|nr:MULTISPECIES: DUF3784 domain-containing protein [Priestia]KSU89171.1 hypothetical protein AS180_04030 [Priestia veravalensis]WEZ08669.1 DUF3784 domain-containing protein [Priestia flexa]SCB93847.1 protein of unknown function [Priestia flexa]
MDLNLIIFGILFLVLGYLIGVKKQTWLLSGFNEKRVKNKKKLAHLVGGTLVFLSILLIIGGIIGWLTPEYIMIFVVAVMLGLIFYVNIMLVE